MCPSTKGEKSEVLDLLHLEALYLEAQKHQFAMYMNNKHIDFLKSLLQQFNFQKAEKTTPTEESEEVETEWESTEDDEANNEIESEKNEEKEKNEEEHPIETSKSKGKEKIVIDEEFETKEEKDVDQP